MKCNVLIKVCFNDHNNEYEEKCQWDFKFYPNDDEKSKNKLLQAVKDAQEDLLDKAVKNAKEKSNNLIRRISLQVTADVKISDAITWKVRSVGLNPEKYEFSTVTIIPAYPQPTDWEPLG